MKAQFFTFLAGAFLYLAVASVRAQNATINIMAMGDSVTARGSSPESSYRYWLYLDLTNAGFENIAFVGDQFGVSDGTPANSWPQEWYEGDGPSGDGWTSWTGVSNAPSAAVTLNSPAPYPNTTPPGAEIVLLDLGANDFVWNIPLGQTETNLETIIQTFAAQDPNVVILLATPTGFVPPVGLTRQEIKQQRSEQSHLAGSISRVARTQRKARVDVVQVNLFGGFNANRDTKDGTHPNVAGEQMIARKYFKALRPILKKMEKQGL